jgi:hypothetical protein
LITVNVAAVPLKSTDVTPLRLLPVICIVVPGHPLAGVNPEKVMDGCGLIVTGTACEGQLPDAVTDTL